jgi:hypothetical protein
MQLDEKIYKPQTVLARISDAKNNLLNAHAYSQDNQLLSQDAASSKMCQPPRCANLQDVRISKMCESPGCAKL